MATQTITPQQRQLWIARTINAIAAAHGIESQRDLGERLGWTESKLSRKLHQDTRFSLEDVIHVADALGVEYGELLNGWGGRVPIPPDPQTPAATGTQRDRNTSHTPQYVPDWSGSLSNGAEPTFTDADWAEITAYLTGVLA